MAEIVDLTAQSAAVTSLEYLVTQVSGERAKKRPITDLAVYGGPPGITELTQASFTTVGSGYLEVDWSSSWAQYIVVTGPITSELRIAMPAGTTNTGRQVLIKRSSDCVGPYRVKVTNLGSDWTGTTSLTQPSMWVGVDWNSEDLWQRRLHNQDPRAAYDVGVTVLTDGSFTAGSYAVDPSAIGEAILVNDLGGTRAIAFDRTHASSMLGQRVVIRRDDGSGNTLNVTGLGSGGSTTLSPADGEWLEVYYHTDRTWRVVRTGAGF